MVIGAWGGEGHIHVWSGEVTDTTMEVSFKFHLLTNNKVEVNFTFIGSPTCYCLAFSASSSLPILPCQWHPKLGAIHVKMQKSHAWGDKHSGQGAVDTRRGEECPIKDRSKRRE